MASRKIVNISFEIGLMKPVFGVLRNCRIVKGLPTNGPVGTVADSFR